MHVSKILQSLNAGELSPLMDVRIDQMKYQSGCRTLENFYPLIYGGVERRPGTYYVAESKENTKIRMVRFIHSVDEAYMLEFGNQYMRVYHDGGRFVGCLLADTAAWVTGTAYVAGDFVKVSSVIYRCLFNHTSGVWVTDLAAAYWEAAALTSDLYPIYELVTPYLTADLFELKFEHSADVSYITHPDYEPRKLSRTSATTWTLEVIGYEDGPFLDQNVDTADTIAVTEIAGGGIAKGASVTLTAVGCTPFVDGTTAGHEPSGSLPTSKSQTGALWKVVHSLTTMNVDYAFTAAVQESGSLLVYKGVHWDWITNGTWTGTLTLKRSYDNTNWETVHVVSSENNANAKVDMVERDNDAYYKTVSTNSPSGSWSGTASIQFMVREQSHIGIVKITAVTSTSVAVATVLQTIASSAATSRWSEGYWSNYRGWPIACAFSPEDRIVFGGSISYPSTVWGSVIGDYESMKEGVLDDDAFIFMIIGTRELNTVRWMVSKNSIIIGTYGSEHILSASAEDEPITPTNVSTKVQSTYGSADIQAIIVNDCVIFVQRGGRKIKEMSYSFQQDSYIADDLTILANHITESGITWMAYQRAPDPMLWCGRTDGQIALLSYDKKQEVWAWSRLITRTLAGDSEFESGDIIPGAEEDQVWVSVKRVINGQTKRYVEFFASRAF